MQVQVQMPQVKWSCYLEIWSVEICIGLRTGRCVRQESYDRFVDLGRVALVRGGHLWVVFVPVWMSIFALVAESVFAEYVVVSAYVLWSPHCSGRL